MKCSSITAIILFILSKITFRLVTLILNCPSYHLFIAAHQDKEAIGIYFQFRQRLYTYGGHKSEAKGGKTFSGVNSENAQPGQLTAPIPRQATKYLLGLHNTQMGAPPRQLKYIHFGS